MRTSHPCRGPWVQEQAPNEDLAIYSGDKVYRYWLTRTTPVGGKLTLFLCAVNPSTATAAQNDPTIRRVIGFANSWGYGKVIIGNLFGLRSTNIGGLGEVSDPIGPDNDLFLGQAATEADLIVAAWGNLMKVPKKYRGRGDEVLDLIRRRSYKPVHCIRKTSTGWPEHPLYLPGDLKPIPLE